MSKKHLVVLSGAGISAESGIPTFRGSDGLWEGHRLEDVATPEAWQRDPALVLEFYNQRRKAALHVQPNAGHKALAELEEHFQVSIITQNIDNLHEKAGSSQVLHLHGELFKCRSVLDENTLYEIDGWELKLGDCCPAGGQLRPHVVWFGEPVPMMERAMELAATADLFLIVGTSLLVYPAANLIYYVPSQAAKYVIDPKLPALPNMPQLELIEEKASVGLPMLAERLQKKYAVGNKLKNKKS
jgi:NAD-dependent deacetylase